MRSILLLFVFFYVGDCVKAQFGEQTRYTLGDSSQVKIYFYQNGVQSTDTTEKVKVSPILKRRWLFYDTITVPKLRSLTGEPMVSWYDIRGNIRSTKLGYGIVADSTFKSDTASVHGLMSKDRAAASIAAIMSAVDGKVNISDTSTALNSYLRKSDTTNKWQSKGAYITPADTINKWQAKGSYQPAGSYISPSDTVGKWKPINYQPDLSGYATNTALGVKADSSRSYTKATSDGRYLQSYTETDPLSVKISDSSLFLRKTQAATTYQPLGNYATSAALANKVNISDTAFMLSPYLKSATAASTYATSSSLSGYATTSQLNAKVNISDTASMLSPYAKNSQLGSYATAASLTSGLAGKVNISDTATMLTNYARKTSITTPTINNNPARVFGTSYQATSNMWVNYSITHTVTLTLVVLNGASNVYLETSPNNSTWTIVNQTGFTKGVSLAVAIADVSTGNLSGEVPNGYYWRIRSVVSGGGANTIATQQEKSY